MKHVWVFWILIFLLPVPARAEVSTESLINKGRGVLICSGGGGQKPLFNSECKTLSINRVTSGGAIKYEVACTDSSNTTFQLACDAFSYEQKQVVF